MRQCGYADNLLLDNYRFGDDRSVDLAAFAHEPTDARSACVAVVVEAMDARARVDSCRELGSPIVLVLEPGAMQVWRQGKEEPQLAQEVAAADAGPFLRQHRCEFAPEAVYRAKTWARLERDFQLSFVDVGFMPVIEAEMGKRLRMLIERLFQGLRSHFGTEAAPIPERLALWLLKCSFWLVAGKVLQDKRVEGFIEADLCDVANLFRRIAKHYDSRRGGGAGVDIGTKKERAALVEAAEKVAQFSNLAHVTTESLAHVYESTLITRDVRKSLGTHSTPQYLVDYVVWKLAPWIEEIPVERRNVFEPACGHAAFLVTAMRLLNELLPPRRREARQQYLRERLHGIEVDPFALEIARLSLTLADIPHPDGWDLSCADVFAGPDLGKQARQATIVLGNPPFEKFTAKERAGYAQAGTGLAHQSKAGELLHRVLLNLPQGAVVGFVVPEALLHSAEARDIRKLLVEGFEIGEMCLLPDKVFEYSDAECAVITARRAAAPPAGHRISYRRVREPDFDHFRLDYDVTTRQSVAQESLGPDDDWNMRLPDLHEVWTSLVFSRRLGDVADVGKGFEFKARDLPPDAVTIFTASGHGEPGFVEFDVKLTHQLPVEHCLNLGADVIRRRGAGTATGCPQVLLNYAPVSRGPWRLRALIDRQGHAVTSRFITVRPRSADVPLEYLWALLNSPLANAYAYCWLAKRDILVGTMRKMPVPQASPADMRQVGERARSYLEEVAKSGATLQGSYSEPRARRLILELDAEVLRLYDLSPRLERQLLDLFSGHPRQGVPFQLDRYFPDDFEPWVHLHEYLSEDFARSTAGALRSLKEPVPQAIVEALRRAAKEFGE